MSVAFDRLHVLTGGPGSGKTTLIEALRDAGHAGMIEAGRGVIRDQVSIGGSALPWLDPLLFAELMLSWDMRSYQAALSHEGPVFFDRGVPDVVGYLRLMGMPVPTHMERAAQEFRYCRRVFIAPPWREIFENDLERRQDFDEAVLTYETLVETYPDYGYELVELPRSTVSERVRFVIGAIAARRTFDPPRRGG